MPLHDGYLKEMKESTVADLNNLGVGRSGGACSAAMFLKEFVTGLESPITNISGDSELDDSVEQTEQDSIAWAHIDIAGGELRFGASSKYNMSPSTNNMVSSDGF